MLGSHNTFGDAGGEVTKLVDVTGTVTNPEANKTILLSRSARFGQKTPAGVESLFFFSSTGELKTGRVIWVDDVFGDDSTGQRESLTKPFKTIEAAIAAAVSGDHIWILPGTYNPTGTLTIPANVTLRGVAVQAVIIQKAATANTTFITVGDNCRVEDVTVNLTSTGHFTLIGILYGGATPGSAKIRNAVIKVDNSGAGAGASDVTGIAVRATAMPTPEFTAIRATTITVKSTGTGTKRGILVDATASNFNIRDVNVRCESATGSAIGAETNIAGSKFVFQFGNCFGTTADISRTLGDIELGYVDLINSSANGKGFTAQFISWGVQWGDDGGLPGNVTRYMRPGTGAVALNEVKVRLPRKAIVKRLRVTAFQAPGAGKTDTFTVRKNGADTALLANLSDTNLAVSNDVDSVTFQKDDDLSVKVVTAIATAIQDVIVTAEIY